MIKKLIKRELKKENNGRIPKRVEFSNDQLQKIRTFKKLQELEE